jgi:hypothetical protein
MTRRRKALAVLLTVGFVASVSIFSVSTGSVLLAQTPAPNVGISFGIDTSVTEVRDIVRLTRAYLAHPDSTAQSRGLWSTQSRFDARYGDLALEAYQGFPATIIGVTGTGAGDSVFVVKIIHGSADSSGTLRPLALQRIYVIRAPGSPFGWQLSSPLPRLTRGWVHRDFGRVTYWYGPGQTPSSLKGRRAAQFIDSVAALFGVNPPAHLDAYLTGTMDEGERLLGLDFFPENSGPGTGLGGRGGGPGILLLSNPTLGEAYLHELVHAVIGPTVESRNSLFGEGVATWLGGSEGKSLRELYTSLHDYQQAHPNISLLQLLQGEGGEGHDTVIALYATRALIIDSIYRNSGIAGLRQFGKVSGRPADVIKALPTYIGGMNQDVSQWWREETDRALKRRLFGEPRI